MTGSDKAIGYVDVNYVQGGAQRAVAYEGVMPIAETIKDGSVLPRALNLYTKDPSPAAETFIDFVLSEEGQRIVEGAGFARSAESEKIISRGGRWCVKAPSAALLF